MKPELLSLLVVLVVTSFVWAFKPQWFVTLWFYCAYSLTYVINVFAWTIGLFVPFSNYAGTHRFGEEGLYHVQQRQFVREVIGA